MKFSFRMMSLKLIWKAVSNNFSIACLIVLLIVLPLCHDISLLVLRFLMIFLKICMNSFQMWLKVEVSRSSFIFFHKTDTEMYKNLHFPNNKASTLNKHLNPHCAFYTQS